MQYKAYICGRGRHERRNVLGDQVRWPSPYLSYGVAVRDTTRLQAHLFAPRPRPAPFPRPEGLPLPFPPLPSASVPFPLPLPLPFCTAANPPDAEERHCFRTRKPAFPQGAAKPTRVAGATAVAGVSPAEVDVVAPDNDRTETPKTINQVGWNLSTMQTHRRLQAFFCPLTYR